MSRRLGGWWASAVGLIVLLRPGSANAFSDPASFDQPSAAAGGAGRFFTGSPADGYTCKACHDGGDVPTVSVLGLPLSGYRPDTRYEITIQWPARFDRVALAVELTDSDGRAAGRLRLPTGDEVASSEFCEPASDQVLAAQLTEPTTERQIVQVPDCGAKRLRFLWSAPEDDLGRVWFAGSMVFSDGESDPHHDGVTDFGRVIGSPAHSSEISASCSAASLPAKHRSSHGFVWLVLALSALLLRSRPGGSTLH
jgi:hypothetical protein